MEEVLVIVGLCIFYKNYKIILLFKGKKKIIIKMMGYIKDVYYDISYFCYFIVY